MSTPVLQDRPITRSRAKSIEPKKMSPKKQKPKKKSTPEPKKKPKRKPSKKKKDKKELSPVPDTTKLQLESETITETVPNIEKAVSPAPETIEKAKEITEEAKLFTEEATETTNAKETTEKTNKETTVQKAKEVIEQETKETTEPNNTHTADEVLESTPDGRNPEISRKNDPVVDPVAPGVSLETQTTTATGVTTGITATAVTIVSTQPDSIQQPPRLEPIDDFEMEELNSSPIKKHQYSSPLKRKKNVVFSDDLTSEVPFLPQDVTLEPVCLEATPRRSILKMSEEFSSPFAIKESPNDFHPELPSSWSKGNIIQLPMESPKLERLIQGCVTVLKIKSFENRFEVYASLNHNFKINHPNYMSQLLTKSTKLSTVNTNGLPSSKSLGQSDKNYIAVLSAIVQRDITRMESLLLLSDPDEKENTEDSPGKNDPFCTRVIGQALKLISYFMCDGELNKHLNLPDIRWFYLHSAQMMVKPKISKTLVVPYLSIVKECRFPLRRRRLIFNDVSGADIPQQMLYGVLNMKIFPSTSLVTERFTTIKNLVLNFPLMMLNNFKHWFHTFLLSLCDLSSPFYTKVITAGVASLLEISSCFLENKEVSYMVQQCLDEKVSRDFRSFASEYQIDVANIPDHQNTNYDILVEAIKELISCRRYKQASDLWFGISLLVCDRDNRVDSWGKFHSYYQIVTDKIRNIDSLGQASFINCWRALIYNFCISDLNDLAKYVSSNDLTFKGDTFELSSGLNTKFRYLLSVFYVFKNPSFTPGQRDVAEAMKQIILAMIYTVFNQQKTSKFLGVYWDKILNPIVLHLFKVQDRLYTGFAVDVLRKMINSSKPSNGFQSTRCLSNEKLSVDDLASLDSSWIHNNNHRIVEIIDVFMDKEVDVQQKEALLTILPYIFEKKENIEVTKPKRIIFPIIQRLVSKTSIERINISRILLILDSTIGMANLVNIDNQEDDFLELLIPPRLSELPETTKIKFLNQVLSNKRPEKNFLLVGHFMKHGWQDLVDIPEQLRLAEADIADPNELRIIGALFETLTEDFGPFVKRVVQAIVLLNASQFERILNLISVQRWSLPVFKFFVVLIHDAPFNFMKQMVFNLILVRFEDEITFVDMVKFLIDKGLELELYNLRKGIMKRHQTLSDAQLQFSNVWYGYLSLLKQRNAIKLIDEFLTVSFEYGFKVDEFFPENWENYPSLQAAIRSSELEKLESKSDDTFSADEDSSAEGRTKRRADYEFVPSKRQSPERERETSQEKETGENQEDSEETKKSQIPTPEEGEVVESVVQEKEEPVTKEGVEPEEAESIAESLNTVQVPDSLAHKSYTEVTSFINDIETSIPNFSHQENNQLQIQLLNVVLKLKQSS